MVSKYLIYGLIDPRTGELRYVGKSSSGLKRPKDHWKPSILNKQPTKAINWIKSLISKGMLPQIEILEELDSSLLLNDSEKFWIASVKATGAELLNMTNGGDGQSNGWCPSAEVRIKMARSRPNGLIGYKQEESHKAAISRALMGRPKAPFSAEHRRNNAKAQGGKPFKDKNGNLFHTIPEAVNFTGLHYSTIHRSLKGYRNNKNFQYVEMEN